ncbi:hypothetical protein [Nannocystis sp. SCPEA4]|uniref:hypothetical protein n=1 Tax=Nannocystis sp. SCPEA4 TaxID=2996787 RepID=UPI00226DE0F2|nr:hypothetical protein [Nannocystis sp. SCPEA4]MCY1056836.1 hypothetical protein [Nannocystis sp. SCPEA4]
MALLWRDGRVPYWIDLVVVAVEGGRTLIEAEVSPRFTDDPAIVDGEDRPFLLKVRNSPPWVARRLPFGPVARFPLNWRDDPAAAQLVADPEAGSVSLRRLHLRRLLAAPPVRETFSEILDRLRSPPASDVVWRDPAELLEAIEEAERAMGEWDDAIRASSIDAAFFGEQVGPWARLLRHVVMARAQQRGWMLREAMQSPHLRELVGLEIRGSEVDLRHVAHSRQVQKLRRLVLHDTPITDDEQAALVISKNLAGLVHLTLSRLHMPAARLAEWLDGTPGRSLRELVLVGFADEEHLAVLLARPALLGRLALLRLQDAALGEAQVLRLAECRALANLRVLDLGTSSGHSQISAKAAEALRGAPQFARTRVLL